MTVPGVGGRPLAFESPEKMQVKINSYFKKVKKKKQIPTMSALAYALDISRETLIQYRKKDGFSGPLNRAKQKIEIFWEQQLLTPKVTAGVSFNLKNNFGWKDKQEVHSTGDVILHLDKDDAAMCGLDVDKE
jgi:hypothetical protein